MCTELKVVNLGGAYPQSSRPLVSFKFKKCVNFPHLYNLQNFRKLREMLPQVRVVGE